MRVLQKVSLKLNFSGALHAVGWALSIVFGFGGYLSEFCPRANITLASTECNEFCECMCGLDSRSISEYYCTNTVRKYDHSTSNMHYE